MNPNDFFFFFPALLSPLCLFLLVMISLYFHHSHFLSIPFFLLSFSPSFLLSFSSFSFREVAKDFPCWWTKSFMARTNSSLVCGHFISLENTQNGNNVNKQVRDIICFFIYSIMNLEFKSVHNLSQTILSSLFCIMHFQTSEYSALLSFFSLKS